MSKERIDVIEDIIYCINHQHYVVIYLNENLIPDMRHYQHKAIVHSQFIFGYNREKQIFKVINFSKKSDQMEVIDVAFSDVRSNFYLNYMKNVQVNILGKKDSKFMHCSIVNI